MARSALLSLASVGLFTGALMVSFMGCYGEVANVKGNCDDDSNPCTIDTCDTGATVHNPTVDGETCSLGSNAGKCMAGACQLDCLTGANGMPGACACTADTECPTEETCATWACTAGTCARTPKPDNEIVGMAVAGDCKKNICEAGIAKTIQDLTDTPPEVPSDCQKFTCENMAPKSVADDTDTPADTKGDCNKPVCSNGKPGTAEDNADAPPNTGCVTNSCLAGMIVPTNAPIGTVCPAGACNPMGACVDCFTAVEWMACGGAVCKIKKCDGETSVLATECKSNAASDGVCCDTACTDECKSCNASNTTGMCTLVPYLGTDELFTDPVFNTPAICNATTSKACNGAGKCLITIGKMCNGDTECLSGKCLSPQKVCLGAKGETCASNGACASGKCTNGACE